MIRLNLPLFLYVFNLVLHASIIVWKWESYSSLSQFLSIEFLKEFSPTAKTLPASMIFSWTDWIRYLNYPISLLYHLYCHIEMNLKNFESKNFLCHFNFPSEGCFFCQFLQLQLLIINTDNKIPSQEPNSVSITWLGQFSSSAKFHPIISTWLSLLLLIWWYKEQTTGF
jgi:hypothetical protein